MAQVAVDVAMESTSQQILELLKVVKTMVTDVSKFDWKNFYQQMATDEVFSTKFYNYETSTSPKGEKMNDSVGLTAVPSTETIKGRDDFSNRSAFQTLDCNFVIDESENKMPVAIKDGNGFYNTGKFDVGVMVPLTYWGIQEFDTYYIVHFATKPHPELGCTTVTPWCNEELGYGILTKYYAGKIDGLLYSSSGNAIYNFVSAQSGNTELQKKGIGYHGSGSERTAYLLCMLWIKYATKNSQQIFQGCTRYNFQYKVAQADTNVNYVVLPTAQANNFKVDLTVSIGDATGHTDNLDRGATWMRNIADKVRVTAIEVIEGTANSRVYVEKTGMTITTDTYISSMPLHSGTTDNVQGTDGYIANDGIYPFKLGGVEDMVGAYYISMNELWNKTSASTVDYYVRGKSAWSATGTGWTKVVTVDLGSSDDCWIGDINIDLKTGVITLRTKGAGDSVGVGDREYNGGTGTGWREALRRGFLWSESRAGFSCADLGGGVSGAGWYFALCV
jgi:hypothetical protein|nr:MAG TPA: hypothetical protein [Bacteriophage sp.]